MQKIFILDDEPARHRTFTKRFAGAQITRAFNATDGMACLEDGPYDVAYIDHDLGDWYKVLDEDGETLVERTGLTVLEHMLNNIPREKWPRAVIVHSWNAPRAKLMVELLRDKEVPAAYQPFTA